MYKEEERKKKRAKKEIKERNKEAKREAKRFVDIMDGNEDVQTGTTVEAKKEINAEEVNDILNEPKEDFYVGENNLWQENDFWHEERPKEQQKTEEPKEEEPQVEEPIIEEQKPIEEPKIEPIVEESKPIEEPEIPKTPEKLEEPIIQEPEEDQIEFNSDLFGNWNDEENK